MANTRLSLIFVGFITLFVYSNSHSQISGVVKDAATLEPISEVNILITGTQNGTSTNARGRFSLPAKTFPFEIKLSALGYQTRIIEVYSADSDLVIYLRTETVGLDEIVVSPDRTINPLTNSSPIARSSVTIEQLNQKATNTAVELLRAESGVFVQQTSVGQGSVYIRGRAGRDVLYLFNGMRMNPSFVRSGQNQYFGVMDARLINQLDVYRGPVSVYYGSDALSGGVNISPIVHDYSEESTLSGELLSTLNFEGNGERSAHAKLGYQSSGFTFFAGGSFRDFDYYRMSEQSNDALWFPYDNTLSNADYQFRSFSASSRIKTGAQSDLMLISYYGEIPDAVRLDRVTLGFSIEEQSENLTPRYGYYSNTSPLSFWGNTAEYRHSSLNPTFESLGIKIGYFRLKDHRKQRDYAFNDYPEYSVNASEADYSFALSDTTGFDNSTSNMFQFSADIRSSLSNQVYIKWGADFSYDRVESEQFNNMGQQMLSRYPDGSEYILAGIFAQMDQEITSQLHMEYGIRYSHTFADIPFEGVNSERKYDPYQSDYGQLTGAIGLSYQITPELSLLSNVSSGFRAPNISDLSEVGSRRSDQFQTPNTDLRPEKTGNIDLGFHFGNPNVNAEFYAFWLHYFDKITRVETGNLVDETGQIVPAAQAGSRTDLFNEVTNKNASSMDLFGVEFRSDAVFNRTWSGGMTFTYTRGELKNEDGSTEPADRVPPANGILYLEYKPAERFSIRPQARYAFDHRRISPDEVGDVRVSEDGTDGFVNLQLIVNLEPVNDLHFKLIADNIADVAYREHASSLDGMGRNYTVTVSYRF